MLIDLPHIFALIIALILWILGNDSTTPQSAPVLIRLSKVVILIALLYLIGLLTGYTGAYFSSSRCHSLLTSEPHPPGPSLNQTEYLTNPPP